MMLALEQFLQPSDEIIDVLETSGLLPLAVNRQGLPSQRLHDEIRHDPAVAQTHARTIGVKDPHDARIQTMITMVRHRHRFGEALRFVVYAARTDRVDVTPILLALRPDQRIAID